MPPRTQRHLDRSLTLAGGQKTLRRRGADGNVGRAVFEPDFIAMVHLYL